MVFHVYDISVMASTVVLLAVGTLLIVSPFGFFWFRTGLGLLLYGQVLRNLAFADTLRPVRDILGLSMMRGGQLWSGTYVAVGCLFIIGALRSLPRALAGFVVVGALCWTCLWLWSLVQFFRTRPGEDRIAEPRQTC